MKIAMVCTEKLPVPPIAGGAIQLYIEGILPYLSKDFDITVYGKNHPKLPSKETVDGVKYVRLSASDPAEYVQNLKRTLDSSFDLIHVFNRPRSVLELAQAFPQNKFSLSLHNEMFDAKKITQEDAVKCIKRVEFINTVSKFIADTVQIPYPIAKNKLNVIYSGADMDRFKPNWSKEGLENKKILKEKYGIENYKVVMFVGRFSKKKGVDVLLRAMERVMNHYNNVAFVIVGSKWFGDGREDEYTRSLSTMAKRLNGPVVFTGFLPPSEVYACYNMADIFVCPSQWSEPLARVHYEAMAAGIPIITTNRGGNAEVVSGFGNGFVVDEYAHSEPFAHYIKYLLNNPDKASQIGMVGRRLAEKEFCWPVVASNVADAFNSVMS